MLYTARLLLNTAVKDIQESDYGTVKIWYGYVSKPMFVAFSVFKTEEKETQENDRIMQNNKTHINSMFSDIYIKQLYSERR